MSSARIENVGVRSRWIPFKRGGDTAATQSASIVRLYMPSNPGWLNEVRFVQIGTAMMVVESARWNSVTRSADLWLQATQPYTTESEYETVKPADSTSATGPGPSRTFFLFRITPANFKHVLSPSVSAIGTSQIQVPDTFGISNARKVKYFVSTAGVSAVSSVTRGTYGIRFEVANSGAANEYPTLAIMFDNVSNAVNDTIYSETSTRLGEWFGERIKLFASDFHASPTIPTSEFPDFVYKFCVDQTKAYMAATKIAGSQASNSDDTSYMIQMMLQLSALGHLTGNNYSPTTTSSARWMEMRTALINSFPQTTQDAISAEISRVYTAVQDAYNMRMSEAVQNASALVESQRTYRNTTVKAESIRRVNAGLDINVERERRHVQSLRLQYTIFATAVIVIPLLGFIVAALGRDGASMRIPVSVVCAFFVAGSVVSILVNKFRLRV
jgi:hypothetical protein